jgi:DNA segregation ATPase FtsK/SpoIIIE-like protein
MKNTNIGYACRRYPKYKTVMSEDFKDGLYETAKTLVINNHNASFTFLSRRLKIGYHRAILLMKELEKEGIVSGSSPDNPRQINETRLFL